MSRQELLADAVATSRVLLLRYLAGFDEANRTAQAPNLPNHVIWTLGHLSLTMLRAAERVKGFDTPRPLPESDWETGDGTKGDVMRFDTESVAFKSTPSPASSIYPSLARGLEIFERATGMLAETVRKASDAALDRGTKWGAMPVKVSDVVARMVFHNGTHCGQIADLRRALKMGTVLG